jgi:hypothetical protein
MPMTQESYPLNGFDCFLYGLRRLLAHRDVDRAFAETITACQATHTDAPSRGMWVDAVNAYAVDWNRTEPLYDVMNYFMI